VWGISQSTFLERLVRQEYDFLAELEIEDGKLTEAFRLGPGAPYYLSLILTSLDREQSVEKLLTIQWQRGDSPWQEEAALLLLSIQMEKRRYGEAETLARQVLRRTRGQGYRFLAQRELAAALYWQEQDEEVLTLLEELRNNGAPWDDELDLFAAVSSQRLERQGWQQLFNDLFYSRSTSNLHSRAYAYMEQEGILDSFPQGAALFFRVKDLLYRGQNSEAVDLIEKSLPGLEIELLDLDILIEEMGAAYFAVAGHNRGAEVLLDLSERISPSQRLDAVEMAGRLYRKEGNFSEARRLLSEVVRETDSPEQRDRAILGNFSTRSRSWHLYGMSLFFSGISSRRRSLGWLLRETGRTCSFSTVCSKDLVRRIQQPGWPISTHGLLL
jgi:tetratricopeptide (TPR) repeat protein